MQAKLASYGKLTFAQGAFGSWTPGEIAPEESSGGQVDYVLDYARQSRSVRAAVRAFAPRAPRSTKASAVEFFVPVPPEAATSLAMALIASSQAPLVLLDDELKVVSASNSFCHAFDLPQFGLIGTRFAELGDGSGTSNS